MVAGQQINLLLQATQPLGVTPHRDTAMRTTSRFGTRIGGTRTGATRTGGGRFFLGAGAARRRATAPRSAGRPAQQTTSFETLRKELEAYGALPPSERDLALATGDILEAMRSLRDDGKLALWNAAGTTSRRRNVFPGELSRGPNKLACEPSAIATPSVRNDAAFLFTVVITTSVLATVAGVVLPGDWGFFSSYLIGGINLVVLAIGSTAPGLLTVLTDKFSLVFPDYRERTLRHEAGHFLLAYLHGAPIASYSLELRGARVQLAQAVLQRKLYAGRLEDEELDSLAVIAMGGVAAEAIKYEEVIGQTEDLFDLQSLMNKSQKELSDSEQQNLTRWAVSRAVGLLRENSDAYERLMEKMSQNATVFECIQAIEGL